MTTQLTLFSDSPKISPKRRPVSEKRLRRLFWTQRNHVKMTDPHYLQTLSPAGLKLSRDWRLLVRIPGYYTLYPVQPADYWEYMHARKVRLWKLVQGYDAKQFEMSGIAMNFLKAGDSESAAPFQVQAAAYKAKADYYYSLYQSHTYHL